MKPVKFPQANGQLVGPEGTDIQPLPCYRDGTWVISRWKPTLWERIKILCGGKITLWLMSGHTQPPCMITAEPVQMITQEMINSSAASAVKKEFAKL